MLGRGFFELEFSSLEGRLATLGQNFHGLDGQAISFSPWSPQFTSDSLEATRELRHPIWMQLTGLNRILRQEEFLKALAGQIGEVILIENSDSYKGKTAGPRIRILVQDLASLPSTVTFLGPEGVSQKIKVIYSGLQNQCNRCRGFGHYARDCQQAKQPYLGRHPQQQHQDPGWKNDRYYNQDRGKPKRAQIAPGAQRTRQAPPPEQEQLLVPPPETSHADQVPPEPGGQGKGKSSVKKQHQEWRPRNTSTLERMNLHTLAANTGMQEEETQQFPVHCSQAPGEIHVAATTFNDREAVAAALPDPKSNLLTPSSQAPVPQQGAKDLVPHPTLAWNVDSQDSVNKGFNQGWAEKREAGQNKHLKPAAQSRKGTFRSRQVDSNEMEVSAPFEGWLDAQNASGSGGSSEETNKTRETSKGQQTADKEADKMTAAPEKAPGPKLTRPSGLEAAELLKKRGYRTTDLSPNFWKALNLHPPSAPGASRMVVIPVLAVKAEAEEGEDQEEDKHKSIIEKAGRHNNALARIQISAHDSGSWTPDKAKELLVNETAFALSKLLKYGKTSSPPITKWEDASWHYVWSINKHHGTLCCTWIAITLLEADTEFGFHKPGKHMWAQLPEVMEALLKTRKPGVIEHLPDGFYSHLTNLPLGSQDSSPPKPALKKKKQASSQAQAAEGRVEGGLLGETNLV